MERLPEYLRDWFLGWSKLNDLESGVVVCTHTYLCNKNSLERNIIERKRRQVSWCVDTDIVDCVKY
uniref:CSON008815 protein n=1 Tax=Culicoides sonorensis TaxID=179676 RepID=A0A336MZ54_CULSO